MKLLSLSQYSIAALGIAILHTISFAFMPDSFPCLLPIVLLLVVSGWILSQAFFSRYQFGTALGVLLTLSVYPISITPVYWLFGYYDWYPFALSLLILLLLGAVVYRYPIPRPTLPKRNNIPWKEALISVPAVGAAILLLGRVITRMSGDTILSPWNMFGPKFWILISGTLLLFMLTERYINSTPLRFIRLSLWYLCTYGMLLFTHKYAFGFDQHIHLASMEWIRTHGVLEPKVPYYLGQYFLAIPLADITHLSLDWISRALVPVGAALTMPLFLLSLRIRPALLYLLPLLPLSFLTFTTPNNFGLLLALLTILLLIQEQIRDSMTGKVLLGILTLWTLLVHPLIGIPLLCTVLFLLAEQKWQQVLAIAGQLLAVPLLLTLYGGGTELTIAPEVFISLFQQPHWYIGITDSIMLNLLYQVKPYVWLLVLLTAAIGWYTHRTKTHTMLLISMTASLLSVAIIASMVRFPDLISYEQGVYAARLLSFTTLLLVPLLLSGLQALSRYRILIILLLPFTLLSLFFLYPTRDAISYYTGVNIRDADVEAIEFVEAHAAGEPYIVLTNQTVSAAALSKFGFERYIDVPRGTEEYFYAIPTGGPLYHYFREYIYGGYNRSSIEDAMEFAGVEKAYLIHTNYWAPAAEIRDVSREIADEWWEFGSGQTWVYMFTK